MDSDAPPEPGAPIDRTPSAVKVTAAYRRAPGTEVAAFQGALAGLGPATGIAGLRRHVRSITTPRGYARREPVYDALDELWFEDEASARAAVGSDGFAELLGSLGLDPASVAAFLVHDHLVKDGPVPAGALKNYEFVTRRPDLTVAEFRRYWLEHHGPLACGIESMLRYVQSHAIDSEYAGGATPAWEGTAITWFENLDGMRESGASPVYAATRNDEQNFLGAPLRLPFIITTEHVLLADTGAKR